MASKQSDSVTSSELQNSGNNYIEEVNDQGSTQSSLTPSLTEAEVSQSTSRNHKKKEQHKKSDSYASPLPVTSSDASKKIISKMKDLLSPEGLHSASSKRHRPTPNAMDIDDNPHGLKRVVLDRTKKLQRKKSILHSNPMRATSCDASRELISKIKDLYRGRVLPIEQKYGLYEFCLQTDGPIEDAEFDAKPMVLLLGQYSTGKTTFVRHLVGGDYPGMHIGPEPTTDKFMALVHGEQDDAEDDDGYELVEHTAEERNHDQNAETEITGRIMRGNSLTVTPELPFSGLSSCGTGFLSSFVGSVSNAPLLKHVTLIDTPGVLSGEKQRSRSYNFAKATKWFADRSDLILLLFDAHKLDISDELKDIIKCIRPHNDDKIRCILNKADGVTREQLVRVYGSLLWSMGKIFDSPEVVRVYTGSYWDEPLQHDDFQSMFESDEWLLIHELINLPKSCIERKVNELVKRIRMIKVHVCILAYLKKQMPYWFRKKIARENLIQNLDKVFNAVQSEYKLSEGDMPDINEFAQCLMEVKDFSKFKTIDKEILRTLDDMITCDIPAIMKGAGGITGPRGDASKKQRSTRDGKDPNVGYSDKHIKRKGNLGRIVFIIIIVAIILCLVFVMSTSRGQGFIYSFSFPSSEDIYSFLFPSSEELVRDVSSEELVRDVSSEESM